MTIAAFILGLIGTVTGCLALVVQWLTYRRDSEKLCLEASREEQTSEPFFKWRGGGANHASAINRFDVYREFTNEGGAVTELEIKAGDGVKAAVVPKDHIGEHGNGKIELFIFGVNAMPEVTFEISYVTHLNRRSKHCFVWSALAASPKRI